MRRPFPRALKVAGLVAGVAALILAVVVPLPGTDSLRISAKAVAALRGGGDVLRVVLRVTSKRPSLIAESTRAGWVDLDRGTARWTQTADGRVVAETLVEPGRFSSYLTGERTLVVGPSCPTFAAGCPDVTDPIALYAETLLGAEDVRPTNAALGGSAAYRIVLPVRALLRALRVEQVVMLDRTTFLPRRIEWREVSLDGLPRTIAVFGVEEVERVARHEVPAGSFDLSLPPGVPVVERVAPREPLLIVGGGVLSVEDARGLSPPLLWLGPTFGGFALTEIVETQWNAGSVFELRYGPVTVWNYGPVIPLELLAGRYREVQTVAVGAEVARLYTTENGRPVAEVDRGSRTAAVVGSDGAVQPVGALRKLRELR